MNLDRDLFLEADDFAKAYNVSITVAAEAVLAGRKLEELSKEHHEAHPDLIFAQAQAAVLDTPEGERLYTKMHPRSKPKAVKVDPQVLYAARFALRHVLSPRLAAAFDDAEQPTGRHKAFADRVGPNLSKVTENQIVDVALHQLCLHLERHAEREPGKTGIQFFDEGDDFGDTKPGDE